MSEKSHWHSWLWMLKTAGFGWSICVGGLAGLLTSLYEAIGSMCIVLALRVLAGLYATFKDAPESLENFDSGRP